jgi:hypothetical protein
MAEAAVGLPAAWTACSSAREFVRSSPAGIRSPNCSRCRTRCYIIAPADEKGFLDAVAGHATHLERRNFGLALPFAAPTVI